MAITEIMIRDKIFFEYDPGCVQPYYRGDQDSDSTSDYYESGYYFNSQARAKVSVCHTFMN